MFVTQVFLVPAVFAGGLVGTVSQFVQVHGSILLVFVFDINETIMAKWKGNTNNEYYRTEPMKKVLKYKFQYV
jgi:hypothetical protein